MTRVHIESGICGFSTAVRVSKGKGGKVDVAIESTCEKIQGLGKELSEMDMMHVLKSPINENTVYVKAGLCRLHTSCPVPCGVIKAAEAELDLALKKDVKVEFVEEE
jgi:hypothetical protein